MPKGHYEEVEVESYIPASTSVLHGEVHIRPAPGQRFPSTMHVSCSRSLKRDYPVGTRFILLAALTDREGGGQFLYSNPRDRPRPIDQ